MIDPIVPASLSLTSLDFATSEMLDKSSDSPESIKKSATQFEALLIGEVLKSARASDGSGWMDTDEDDAGSILSEVSEQQLSQALAAGGGLGLAKTIATGLAKTASKANIQATDKGAKK
jgi:Rod binding domain-containing protein